MRDPAFDDGERERGEGYYGNWCLEHIYLLEDYLNNVFSDEDYTKMMRLLLSQPETTYHILRDYLTDNEDKVERVVRAITSGSSTVIVVVGRRGAGKTAFMWWVGELVKDKRPVCMVGVPRAMPDWCIHINKIEDAPDDALLLLDEAAISHSARRSMSRENVTAIDQLTTIRHKGNACVFVTLSTRLIDKNIIALADVLVFKSQSNIGLRLERGYWDKDLLRKLMPKTPVRTLYYISPTNFTSFMQPLPDCWTDELSKPYKKISKEEAIKIAREMLDGGWTLRRIAKELNARSFSCSHVWVKTVADEYKKEKKNILGEF